MIIKKCLICKKEFKFHPSQKRKYCSRNCAAKGTLNGFRKGHPQYNIGKENFKKGHIPWNKGIKRPEISGKNHPRWKGGKWQKEGRWFILASNHPRSHKGYIRRSHLVAEKCLGRYLTRKEVIHHIDGNTLNDRPENLYVFPNNLKHLYFHHLKIKSELISNLSK